MKALLGRAILVSVLLAAGIHAGHLVLPDNVFACSCARIGTLRDLAGKPDVYVLAGTIRDVRDDGSGQHGTFTISRVYQGAVQSVSLPIRGGGGGDCTIDLRQATDVLIVSRFDNGALEPGLCSPLGDLSTPEGRTLLAEADATWPLPTGPATSAEVSGFDPALLAILVVTPLAAFIVIAAIVAANRRRGAESEAR
ncbi:MAG TPA: hypothetical protein VJ850_00120 [Candidatus Limnocylindrales bacterium]|nr:hypothetical protein [Candidatus Limnocylindrales bacterium]